MGNGVFLWGEKKLKLERGGICVSILKTLTATELYALKQSVECLLNFTSIKSKIKQKKRIPCLLLI